MKPNNLALLALLIALPAMASDDTIPASVISRTIVPGEVTTLHLRAEFESVIHFPELVTSVVLGDPENFKGEHSEGEPDYVYVKPVTRRPSQSNLLVALKSGQHVMLELVNDGATTSGATPVDFLLEYKQEQSFLVTDVSPDEPAIKTEPDRAAHSLSPTAAPDKGAPASALDLEYAQEQRIHNPVWTKWPDKDVETSVGDTRQWENQVAVSFSVFNPTATPLEIVPPQVQISGLKLKKKAKHSQNVTADQLEIKDYRLSATRLEPGERADGVVLFDRPNYKQSSEQLFLQIAEAAKVDQPILVRLPFTSTDRRQPRQIKEGLTMDALNSNHTSPISLDEDEQIPKAEAAPAAPISSGPSVATPYGPVRATGPVPAPPQPTSPASFATRLSASAKTPLETTKLIGIGAALALALGFFLFASFNSRTASKHVPAATKPVDQQPKTGLLGQSTTIPMMDPVLKKNEESGGRILPSDIERTRGQADPLKASAAPTTANANAGPGKPSAVSSGKPLGSVPSFNDTQQKWQEPAPYGTAAAGTTGSSATAVEAQKEDRGLTQASLLYVKTPSKNEVGAKENSSATEKDAALILREGTRIEARLETQVSSSIHSPVIAVVENTYAIGDQVLVPAGSRIYGKLTQVDATGSVGVDFNQIEIADGARSQITAIGTGLDLGPIKGRVEGRNAGRNFLVRAGTGIASTATALVGASSGAAYSQDTQIRERAAQNIGTAGDTEIASLNSNTRIIVSVPANTKIYVMWTQHARNSESTTATASTAADSAQ